MKFLLIQVSVILLFTLSCTQETSFDLEALESGILPTTNPASGPDEWLLAHIDVETTGLLPGYHEMIDIGLVMTNLDGDVLDSLFLRIQPQYPERLSPGAYNSNAFDPEKWKELQALPIKTAVDSIIAFHKKVAGDKNVLMVAYNCQFDTAFLDHLFRVAGKTWRELYHYFVLDIPSMAWGLGLTDLSSQKLMALYNIPNEPHIAEFHTGITGAMVNVRIYQGLLRYRQEHAINGL
ncbi:3'-5' exonuclease [bacterium]|nr:3'-5' exonuclease [bacterium]